MGSRVSEVDGVRITQIKSSDDIRGSFVKFHPNLDLDSQLDSVAISYNPKPGTIRGIHFQTEPFAEEKLVSCLQGSIFDVAVDLRPNSTTFGKWTSFELSQEGAQQAYLPKGVAHGFQTLAPNTIVHYCISTSYSANSSFAINPFGNLGIDWPLKPYVISQRDVEGIDFPNAAQKYAESLKG